MATFPTNAIPLFSGFGIARESAVKRTDMESGPAKQTKVKSRVSVKRQITYEFRSQANYDSFITWFETDADYGAAWFNWVDPVGGATKTARIVEKIDGERPAMPDLGVWQVSLVIETWSN